MKLGVFTVPYSGEPFEAALDRLAELGVEAVEVGTGNYPGDAHCKPEELLADPDKAKAFRRAVESRGMEISGLSQHGNPLHPDETFRMRDRQVWERTIRLAELLEVPVVMAFSGCPGDHPGAKYPNWVTCFWPEDYARILQWQWSDVVVPYWTEAIAFARAHGVTRIGLEMHPGFVVYNPETLLRLRSAVGPEVGANLDPSHLFWQGMDAIEVIKLLGREEAIFHAHAKDTYLDRGNIARNGVLDTKPYDRVAERSWTFRTVGYGMGEQTWREIVSALRAVGYDGVLSIEHEDPLMSVDEGLGKAVTALRDLLIREPAPKMWWA